MKGRAILLLLIGCSSAPGEVSLSIDWEDPPLREAGHFAFARVEREGATVSEASPAALDQGALQLELPNIPNQDALVIVVEVRAGPDPAGHVLYYGLSEPFALRPGQRARPEVLVPLRRTPHSAKVEVRGAPGRASSDLVSSPTVSLSLTAARATGALVANDANLAGPARTVMLEDGRAELEGWNILEGVEERRDGARALFVRFFNERGYTSTTARAIVHLDTRPPRLSGPIALSRCDGVSRAPGQCSTDVNPLAAPSQLWVKQQIACVYDNPACPQRAQGPIELVAAFDEPIDPDSARLEVEGAGAFVIDPCASGARTLTARYTPRAMDEGANGALKLWISDLAGNQAMLQLGQLRFDFELPVASTAALRLERRPHGGADEALTQSAPPLTRVVGELSEPGELLFFESPLAQPIGCAKGPRIDAALLEDAARVFAVHLDPAGNMSAPALIERVTFTTSLEAPEHRLAVTGRHPSPLEEYTPSSATPLSAPGDHDGLPLRLELLSSNRLGQLERQPSGAPSRGDLSAAYDPIRGWLVLREGADLWIEDGEGLHKRCEGCAPAGPMIFEPRLALTLAVDGLSTWGFDGEWRLLCDGGAGCEAPARPGPLAFDERLGQAALYTSDGALWTFDGRAWSEVCVNCPPGQRIGASMSFDPERGLLLFGGLDGSARADLWRFDGQTWSEVCAACGPAPRSGATLAYDQGLLRTVLIGGGFADEHQLEGAGFVERCDGECGFGPLEGAILLWDSRRSRARLLGGGPDFQEHRRDGPRWRPVCFEAGCAPSQAGGLGYDPLSAQVMAHRDLTTWGFDGTSWRILCEGPGCDAPAPHQRLLYFDQGAMRRLDARGLLEWSGAAWTSVCELCGRNQPFDSAFEAVQDTGRGRIVALEGVGGALEHWELEGQTWSRRCDGTPPDLCAPPPGPTPGPMVHDPARQRTLMFQRSSPGQLFEWDGQRWEARCDGSPAADTCSLPFVQAAFYHPELGVVLVSPLGLYTWDGAAASPLCPVDAAALGPGEDCLPDPLLRPVYDPARQRMVALLGDQTWTWSRAQRSRPAALLELSLEEACPEGRCAYETLSARVLAGATAGVRLDGLTFGRWEALPLDPLDPLDQEGSWDQPAAYALAPLDAARARALIAGRKVRLAVTTSTAPELEAGRARLTVDYAELTIQLRLLP